MRRGAEVCFWLAMAFLAAGTGCLAAQDSEQIPAEAEEPAAAISEDAAGQDLEQIPEDLEETEESADFVPEEDAEIQDTPPDWQSELDLIADLLIDGKPLEAKGKADQLLEAENLPESVASRARALRDKADAKLAESPPVKAEPRPKIEIPPKEESGEKSEKTTAAAKEQSFKVRVAAIGGGFSQGATGLLRISETGISFIPQEKTGESWSIRWQNLAEAKSDTGLWDAPYPLVLIERGGRKRYVARLDRKGTYLPGAPLLSAIVDGRRK